MIRLVKLDLQAAVAELERRYHEPVTPPVAVIAADEKSAPSQRQSTETKGE